MTTYAQYVEQTAIPKLAEGKTYNISGIERFDSIEFQGKELDRVVLNLADGGQVSALGMAILNQARRFEKYFNEAKDADPITAMATQVKGSLKESKNHNAYWVFVDPTTKKAL